MDWHTKGSRCLTIVAIIQLLLAAAVLAQVKREHKRVRCLWLLDAHNSFSIDAVDLLLLSTLVY